MHHCVLHRIRGTLPRLYVFLSDTVHIARRQERQAILDALPRAHDPKQNKSWNAGYDAALVAVTQMLVKRSMADQVCGSGQQLLSRLERVQTVNDTGKSCDQQEQFRVADHV